MNWKMAALASCLVISRHSPPAAAASADKRIPVIFADSARGSSQAAYTLVEYSDFQCPFCRQGSRTVEELRRKYGKRLRHVYKHLPMPNHASAMPAARCFEAAKRQSPEKAWVFYQKFFAYQSRLGEAFCREIAEGAGLDYEQLKKDAAGALIRRRIDADIAEAKKFGFDGTPSYLLNGIPVLGYYPVEHFDELIESLER